MAPFYPMILGTVFRHKRVEYPELKRKSFLIPVGEGKRICITTVSVARTGVLLKRVKWPRIRGRCHDITWKRPGVHQDSTALVNIELQPEEIVLLITGTHARSMRISTGRSTA